MSLFDMIAPRQRQIPLAALALLVGLVFALGLVVLARQAGPGASGPDWRGNAGAAEVAQGYL